MTQGNPHRANYVTQKDIAKLANVSQSAVTAALGRTDKIQISAATREKILEAASRLNYSINQQASATRHGRTQQISLIVSGIQLQAVSKRNRHLSTYLNAHNLTVIPHELQWMNWTLEKAWDISLGMRAEGIILSSSFGIMHPPMYKKLLNSPVPVISLCGPSVPSIPLIFPDYRSAFKELTLHLLRQGRRRIVYMSRYRKPDSINQIDWKRTEKKIGFQEAFQEFGPGPQYEIAEIINNDPTTPKNEHSLGQQGMAEIMERHGNKLPDAIVCGNDNFAQGALTEAFQHGIRIPDDLVITGCDGEDWTEYGAIPLTTICQPAREMAELCGSMIVDMLASKAPSSTHFAIPCSIAYRESTEGRKGRTDPRLT